jgi:beta-glucosidase/6-phospho-beta-glucosidase/beta-galactosidase
MAQPFDSFFLAGFECSSHRRKDGVRLDLIRATSHDKHIAEDYAVCAELGFRTIRDGVRWHLIEKAPGKYDWSSWLPALEAAERTGIQVIWDLFHYGSPDHLSQASPDFPERFTDFAIAALELQQSVSGRPPLVCPLNEINFVAWAVREGYFPVANYADDGSFKRQLVRTAITASRAIKSRWPESTIICAEPLIHIAPHDRRRETVREARMNLQGMYEACDWILGREMPELGGDPSLIDVLGWNFYPHNQWYYRGPTIPMGHHEYRPLADLLVEVAERYQKPIFLSETGAEGSGKPSWLHYVCSEVRDALARGTDIRGICWYPITAYPGWDNSRHAETGLLSTVVANGKRHVDTRLYEEFQTQRMLFACEPDQRRRVAGGGRY